MAKNNNKETKKNLSKSNKASDASKDVRVNTDATSTKPNADHGMQECK